MRGSSPEVTVVFVFFCVTSHYKEWSPHWRKEEVFPTPSHAINTHNVAKINWVVRKKHDLGIERGAQAGKTDEVCTLCVVWCSRGVTEWQTVGE